MAHVLVMCVVCLQFHVLPPYGCCPLRGELQGLTRRTLLGRIATTAPLRLLLVIACLGDGQRCLIAGVIAVWYYMDPF